MSSTGSSLWGGLRAGEMGGGLCGRSRWEEDGGDDGRIGEEGANEPDPRPEPTADRARRRATPRGPMDSGPASEGETSVIGELTAPEAGHVRAEFLAAAFVAIGDMDRAFSTLERAYEERAGGLIFLHVDPMYDSLRSDPRYEATVEKIGLKSEWAP
jgi:hypothetical protein